MTQIRYHNYRRALQSFAENLRFQGIIIPGVYSGWDRFEIVTGSSLRLYHDITGVGPTDSDNVTVLNKRGLVVTRQGFFIYEDAPIDITVDTNDANAFTRIDYLICTHQYLASAGGQTAVYSIIKGAVGGPVEPTLVNPATQVVVGKFYIPASASTHTNTVFIRNEVPANGGYGFRKGTERDIITIENKTLVNDFNAQVSSGFFFLNNSPLNPPVTATKWILQVMRNGANIFQFASNPDTGKSYGRASTNSGSTWTAWVNMNNPDVVTDFTPVYNQIGTRIYTEDNYITDLQTLTQSIDALDIALKDRADEIGTANTNISNINTAIGNRTYTTPSFIASGESITASLQKIDDYLELHRTIYVEIGAWNMDTTPTKSVAHGLPTHTKIRSVSAMIFGDSGGIYALESTGDILGLNLQPHGAILNTDGVSDAGINATYVWLVRLGGGIFDGTEFDNTSINRGILKIEYVP